MSDATTQDITLLDTLPPEWPDSLLPEIRERLAGADYKLVILDDDPTGTQTVRDLPVLTVWDEETLARELLDVYPAFFILTNSRSLPEREACGLGREIGSALAVASERTGVRTVVVSRSDSTLRGHFPAEVDAVGETLGKQGLPYLLAPFFLEGGRYTIDDIHYVREGDTLLPAAATPFARDASFGFRHSNLRLWIGEKSGGAIEGGEIRSITIDDIRQGGPSRVATLLGEAASARACIVNCASYRDMEVVIAGLLRAESGGTEFLYRTAASFVRIRCGMAPDGQLLPGAEMVTASGRGGLFVVGSYVAKSSGQLAELLASGLVAPVELQVAELLGEGRAAEVRRVTGKVNRLLATGWDVALYTSRKLVTGRDGEESLAIGNLVSRSLIEVVQTLDGAPSYLVAKGGITSSDVATKGLAVTRAMVQGQVLPGVPVWQLGPESRYPGMSYVVFPGNVGENDALVTVCRQLAAARKEG